MKPSAQWIWLFKADLPSQAWNRDKHSLMILNQVNAYKTWMLHFVVKRIFANSNGLNKRMGYFKQGLECVVVMWLRIWPWYLTGHTTPSAPCRFFFIMTEASDQPDITFCSMTTPSNIQPELYGGQTQQFTNSFNSTPLSRTLPLCHLSSLFKSVVFQF